MLLASMLGSTTMGFGTSHGAQGSRTTLHSTFTPPSLNQAAAMIGNRYRDKRLFTIGFTRPSPNTHQRLFVLRGMSKEWFRVF
jgi:hypothetical protein